MSDHTPARAASGRLSGVMIRPASPAGRCLEVKRYPDGRQVTFDCDLLAIEPGRQLLSYTIRRRGANVAGVFLPAGTRSYGCFWAGRPYNLYLWMRRCGARRDAVLGAYFNVCDQVRLGRTELRWRDLWVDVLALPARTPVTLDREEAPSGLPARLAAHIDQAVAVLHARSGELVEECLRWARAVQAPADQRAAGAVSSGRPPVRRRSTRLSPGPPRSTTRKSVLRRHAITAWCQTPLA